MINIIYLSYFNHQASEDFEYLRHIILPRTEFCILIIKHSSSTAVIKAVI